jgi:hypothetical protein
VARAFLQDLVVEELSIDVDGERLAADLYRPTTPHGALLLVHGLSPAGRRHQELVRLARLLARHGRLVLVPQLEGLAAFRLSGREITEIPAGFGGYAHLRDVVAYVTTGIHDFRGIRYRQRQEEYNRWKLLALLVGLVEDEGDRLTLGLIAKRRLADPRADTGVLEADVGAEGRLILSLVQNRDEKAVGPLLAALPPERVRRWSGCRRSRSSRGFPGAC